MAYAGIVVPSIMGLCTVVPALHEFVRQLRLF
jgi:hypothetical protein